MREDDIRRQNTDEGIREEWVHQQTLEGDRGQMKTSLDKVGRMFLAEGTGWTEYRGIDWHSMFQYWPTALFLPSWTLWRPPGIMTSKMPVMYRRL